jgi:hypothetical protein
MSTLAGVKRFGTELKQRNIQVRFVNLNETVYD